jgi:hypothetical protein
VTSEEARALGQSQRRYPWLTPGELRGSSTAGNTARRSGSENIGLGARFELPNDLGRHPSINQVDTLDPASIVGEWLLVAHVNQEQIVLHEPGSFFPFSFMPDGRMSMMQMSSGQVTSVIDGVWDKPGPGQFSMGIGRSEPLLYYGEMLNRDFFYIWTFSSKNGLWLVRRPQSPSDSIRANEFVFESGQRMKFSAVRGNVIEGYIDGPTFTKIAGGYALGVLNLRWVDESSNSEGYAAFIVSDDWSQLHGVWWLDDYEAAPLGGSWLARRVDAD